MWEFYGSTEGQFTVCSSAEWLERAGTVGRARAGRSLEIDADGAVWCHAPRWARWSYWRDPVRTEAAWRGDAFTVGDLGRLDEDGYLFLAGRRSDLIISGGVNVYPAEVELALIEMPGVDDVVVFPRTERRWGQRVCAAIVGDVDVDGGALRRRAARAVQAAEGKVAAIAHFGLAKVRRDQMARDLGLEPPAEPLAPTGDGD